MSRVTIETICTATGLSRGTVSRALNNRNDINERTKQRVIDACRRLKYRPSHAARSLATGRSDSVQVILHDIRCSYSNAYLRGVLRASQAARFTVSVLELERDPEAGARQLNDLEALPLDGLIFVGPIEIPGLGLSAEYLQSKPIVASHPLHDLDCDTRTPDMREAGRLAARFFAERGVRRARFLFDLSDATGAEKADGFCEVGAGTGDFRKLEVARDAELSKSLAELSDDSAIATASDEIAHSALLALIRLGRIPGQDVALLGCGNESWTGRIRPAISSIDLGAEECGQWAFQTILERISGGRTSKPQRALHPPKVVLRNTTENLKH